jgi:hypothetical protein
MNCYLAVRMSSRILIRVEAATEHCAYTMSHVRTPAHCLAAEAVDAKKIARKRIRNNILYAGVGMVGKREANSVAGGNECDGSGLRTGGVCNCEARVPEEEWRLVWG